MIFLLTLASLLIAGSTCAIPVEEWNMSYLREVGPIDDIEQTADGGYITVAYDSIAKIDASGNRHWIRKLFKLEPDFRGSTGISQVGQTGDGGYIFGGYRSFVSDFGSKQIILIIKTDSEGNEQWNRTFDENTYQYNYFISIQQTQDSGYILAESTTHDNTNDVRIIKLDSNGKTEWIRTFENSLRPSLHQTLDGSYIISISRGKYEDRYPETSLKKLDSKGNDIWNRSYQGMENVHVELTDDGGYMISGEMKSSITNIDAFLIKTDPMGNELWNKTYGGTGDDGFGVIRKTLDGGYILAGYTGADHSTDVMNFYMGDAWLVKVDAEGNKEWDMIFGEFEMKSINSVRQTDGGGYLIAGRSGTKPQGSWIVKLTNDSVSPDISHAQQNENEFSQIWTKIYDVGDEIHAIQQTRDDGIILAGMNFDNYDAVLIKTDSSGNELWNNTFNGGNDERFYANQFHAVDETTDGGYILGGNAVYDIYARYDAWLVKTDSLGKEQWNKTIGNNDAEEDISAVLTVDDGYILSVNVNRRIDIKPPETWLMRTDSKGNQLWIKKYIKGAIRDIKHAKDGGYILVAFEDGGWGYTGDDNPPTGWILRIDESGNEMWRRSFGEYPRKFVTPNSVLQTRDSGYIVVGDYADNINHIQDASIIKFDRYGNEKWRRTIKGIPGGIDQSFHSIVETDDGDYITGGKINMYRTTGMDAILIKIDSSGNELWNMTAGGDGNQVVNSMQQTTDGGLFLAGSMRNIDTEGHWGAMLIKVGKKEETNVTSNTTVGNLKGTSPISQTMGLTAVQSATENVPVEKATGFEAALTIAMFLLMKIFRWNRR
jgi:hypothetical protein